MLFPLEDALGLHENVRFGFPDPPSRQTIPKQGAVAPTRSCKGSSFPSSKRNNTDNVVLSDTFCIPPPPQWPYHSRSCDKETHIGDTDYPRQNHFAFWGSSFTERRTLLFRMQPRHGLGMNFVSLLFQLIIKVG